MTQAGSSLSSQASAVLAGIKAKPGSASFVLRPHAWGVLFLPNWVLSHEPLVRALADQVIE